MQTMHGIFNFTDILVLSIFQAKFENFRHIILLPTPNCRKVINSQKQFGFCPPLQIRAGLEWSCLRSWPISILSAELSYSNYSQLYKRRIHCLVPTLSSTKSSIDAEEEVLTAGKLRCVAESGVHQQWVTGPLTQPYVRTDGSDLR